MEFRELQMNKVRLGKNSRLNVKTSELETLMESMKSIGLLEPIGVTKGRNGSFDICYGNRRFLAASKLGWKKIPAIINADKNQADKDIKNLAENIQRRNISITEAGRYFRLFLEKDFSIKEIGVRLGVNASFVKQCIRAFEEVPQSYQKKIVQTPPGKKPKPGTIAFTTSNKILSTRRKYNLTRPQAEKIYKAATSDPSFNTHEIDQYAAKIKQGVNDFVKKAVKTKNIKVDFLMTEKEYDKLFIEYVDNGPFKTFPELCMNILSGKKHVSIKTIKTRKA